MSPKFETPESVAEQIADRLLQSENSASQHVAEKIRKAPNDLKNLKKAIQLLNLTKEQEKNLKARVEREQFMRLLDTPEWKNKKNGLLASIDKGMGNALGASKKLLVWTVLSLALGYTTGIVNFEALGGTLSTLGSAFGWLGSTLWNLPTSLKAGLAIGVGGYTLGRRQGANAQKKAMERAE